jgi:hypothetical protein
MALARERAHEVAFFLYANTRHTWPLRVNAESKMRANASILLISLV